MIVLVGCSTMSAQGPSSGEITGDAGRDVDFTLVDLTPAALQQFGQPSQPSLLESFGNKMPAPVRTLQQGDVVAVTIWDAGGGLFSTQSPISAQGNAMVPAPQQTVLPNQIVDPSGRITVPFGGQIEVAGKSTLEAQEAIKAALTNQALRPQAIVTLIDDQSNLVTLIGDLKNPNRLPLDINGMRILDAIARAGGALSPAFNEVVELTRGDVQKRVRLSSIISNPAENIYMQPNDTIHVLRDPKTVAVLGAATNNMRLQFDTEQMTLAEAIGLAGGLRDAQAEPAAVFLFRLEPRDRIHGPTPGAAANDAPAPVIFRANLRVPQDYFLAQSFQIQDKDIVYVANADTTQLDKLAVKLLHIGEIIGVGLRRGTVASGP